MAEHGKSRTEKLGLPPGSLVYVGEKPVEKTIISYLLYEQEEVREAVIESIAELPDTPSGDGVLWIQVTGLAQIAWLKELGQRFALHPLVLEDILATDQRPKIESYGPYEFIVLRAFHHEIVQHMADQEQISIIWGKNFVISIQERQSLLFGSPYDWIHQNRGTIRTGGSVFLTYALVDAVVDRYFTFLERFGEELEDLEEELVAEPTQQTLQRIYRLKHAMIQTRKATWPLREVVTRLDREEAPEIRGQTGWYLHDIYDHIIRILETVEMNREMLSGMLDIYLSSISNRMNEVMKVLTIISTIFIPLSFITGIYGMNLLIPETSFPWVYPFLLLIMFLIALGLIVYFRKKRWL
ncbi:MAG: magnesium/cobalt transporter CorA [Candidatus Hermodarchaeota archaeon]|nr:magnesium/cobalt transporter CorA [Candidatus Hermodarchaeota archaeon]